MGNTRDNSMEELAIIKDENQLLKEKLELIQSENDILKVKEQNTKDENQLLKDRLELIQSENEVLKSTQKSLEQNNIGLVEQIELLKKIGQANEKNSSSLQTNYQLLLTENSLLKQKNHSLLEYIHESVSAEDQQLKFSEDMLADFSQIFLENEKESSRITTLQKQIEGLKEAFETHKATLASSSQIDENQKEQISQQIKEQVKAELNKILNGDAFEQLAKKIEARISSQLELEQERIFAEVQLIEARQVEYEAVVDPLIVKQRLKEEKLLEQQELLEQETTKIFYQTVYKHMASKLIAVIVLFSELVKREDTKTDKFGKLTGGMVGDLLGSMPGGSILSTITSFTIEELVSGGKGYFQNKKIKHVMDSLPDPKQAMAMAELIARRLTQNYKKAFLQQDEKEVGKLAENCSRAIYHFIKHGGLNTHADDAAEEKVHYIIDEIRQQKIIENKIDVPEDRLIIDAYGNMRPANSSTMRHVRDRLKSVASREEVTRNSLELYNTSSRSSITWLQTELHTQKEANQKEQEHQQRQLQDLQKQLKTQQMHTQELKSTVEKIQRQMQEHEIRDLGVQQGTPNSKEKKNKKGFFG